MAWDRDEKCEGHMAEALLGGMQWPEFQLKLLQDL